MKLLNITRNNSLILRSKSFSENYNLRLNKLFLIVWGIFTYVSLNSQSTSKTNISDGDIFFHNGIAFCKFNVAPDDYCKEAISFFEEALKYYEKDYSQNQNNAELNYKMGMSYYAINNPSKAIEFLTKSININNKVDANVLYYLALAYKKNSQWDLAIEKFRLFINDCNQKTINSKFCSNLSLIEQHILQCELAKKMSAQKVNYEIKNIGAGINTKYDEYNPVMSHSGYTMLYTSRRPDFSYKPKDMDSVDFEIDFNNYFENIYITYNKDNAWIDGKRLGDLIMIRGVHYAILDISADSKKCLLYNSEDGGGIYEAILENGEWIDIRWIVEINSSQYEPTAVYAPDMNSIYFVSNRRGGLGGKDIYVSSKGSDEKYQAPQNLGNVVNTSFDEDGIFFLNDSTMYFASNGHEGLGGYDIYKTTLRNDIWTKPENIGYPINTPYDDIFFSINDNTNMAFLSSDRHGGFGRQDIYVVNFFDEDSEYTEVLELEDDISSKSKEILVPIQIKGQVIDADLNKGIVAQIVVKNEEGNILFTTQSNPNGEYQINIEKNKKNVIEITSDGYFKYIDELEIQFSPKQLNYKNRLFKSVQNLNISSVKLPFENRSDKIENLVVRGELVDFFDISNTITANIKVIETSLNQLVLSENITRYYELYLENGKNYIVEIDANGFEKEYYTINSEPKKTPFSIVTALYKKKDNKTDFINNLVADKNKPVLYTGRLVSYNTQLPIEAKLEFYDLETEKLIKTLETDKEGRFKILLDADKYFKIDIIANGYMKQSGYVNSNVNTDFVSVELQAILEADAILKNNVDELLVSREMLEYSSLQLNLIDKETGKNVEGILSVNQNKFGLIHNTNTKDSVFVLPVVSDCTYNIEVKAEGYLPLFLSFVAPSALGHYSSQINLVPSISSDIEIELPNVFFSTAKYNIVRDKDCKLEDVAKYILSDKNNVAVLSGHADSRGDEELNMKLSHKRAEAVADFLQKKGVSKNQIEIRAFGETKPVASNETDEGQALNRRVEVTIIKKQ